VGGGELHGAERLYRWQVKAKALVLRSEEPPVEARVMGDNHAPGEQTEQV
jgi:hypothetical protein